MTSSWTPSTTSQTERLAKEWLSAGVGCALSDTVFNPLEVLKVRRQIQASSNATRSVISNQINTLRLAKSAIQEADGSILKGLWQPGLLATLMRGLSYTGFRIGLYPTVRDYYVKTRTPTSARGMDRNAHDGEEASMSESEQFAVKLLAGATTGAIGSAVFNPIDIVRIRMQSQPYRVMNSNSSGGAMMVPTGQQPFYPSTIRAFSMIAKEEGVVRGLWRGVGVCVARASLLSGSQLGTYDAAKRYLLVKNNEEDESTTNKSTMTTTMTTTSPFLFTRDGPALHFTCAFISGVVAQTVTQPVDTLKTLAMSSTNKNSLFLAANVIRERGFFALYNGFWPAAMRQGPVMVLQMPIVEQLRRLCGLEYF